MANKILQIDLQNDITPQIGSYDNAGGVTPNNWLNEDGVYSLGPTNTYGTTPYYWFTPTKEVTDFDLCWEDYQNNSQESPQYRFTIGDSAGNNVITVRRISDNFYFGSVNIGNLAYQTWHKILIQVRKASATTSQIIAYVNGKKVVEDTENVLVTSAKIALLGLVPDSLYWQNAGQRVRYVTIYDRSYSSKGVNLDGIMTTITGFVNKLKGALSTVAFSGSYNDLSDKPTISTVNDGTLTIQQNGVNVQTFTANQSTNATANITVPTKTSDLTNDSGFITSDDTKIPLAGSNQISGSLIPATDNSIDIGSSTNNIKMLYTKGITIDGKTIDTDASGNMTYDGHIVDTIEEQGNGYIRYSNGLQICWGGFMNNNNIEPGKSSYTFPKAFNAEPRIIVTTNLLDMYLVTATTNTTTFTVAFIQCYQIPVTFTQNNVVFDYIAIGTWK